MKRKKPVFVLSLSTNTRTPPFKVCSGTPEITSVFIKQYVLFFGLSLLYYYLEEKDSWTRGMLSENMYCSC